MAQHHAAVRRAERDRRGDVVALAQREHLAAGDARVADPAVGAQRAIMTPSPGRATVATIAMLSRMPGNAIRMSTTRITTSSTDAAEPAGDRADREADHRRDRDDDHADARAPSARPTAAGDSVSTPVRVGAEPVRARRAPRSDARDRRVASRSYGASSGPNTPSERRTPRASPAPIHALGDMRARASCAPDPRVGEPVRQIDERC